MLRLCLTMLVKGAPGDNLWTLNSLKCEQNGSNFTDISKCYSGEKSFVFDPNFNKLCCLPALVQAVICTLHAKGQYLNQWWHSSPTCKCISKPQAVNGNVWDRHDDVIKWKHLPSYWPFVRGIHRSPVNTPNKDQWRGALMFSFIRP